MEHSGNGRAWAAWLGTRVAPHGSDGKMAPADLVERLAENGHRVSAATVSRWLKAMRAKRELVEAVGDIFGDRAGALLAAGYADPALEHAVYAGTTTIIIAEDAEHLAQLEGMTVAELKALPWKLVIQTP